MKNSGKRANGAWEPTRYQKLFRYVPSGTIFARFKIRGKQVRRSLETPDLELARRKLAELEQRERAIAHERRRGKMLFGEALGEFLLSRRNDPTIKSSTLAYDEQRVKSLYKSWPGLEQRDVRRIQREECQSWAASFARQFAPSTYNHTISLVRHAFDVAVERGTRYDNPASGIKRQSPKAKKLRLPSVIQFEDFVYEIQQDGSGKSGHCSDLVRFLAFSGLRKSEAANVLWEDANFGKGTLRVYGDPLLRTKNGEFRTIPMLPEMCELLQRLRAANPDAAPTDPVMRFKECQKAMDRAAAVVGMARITHHDLRHLFATRCIESGVDILTVSRWLGHKDGGALAMRTYGHLRDEHSQEMAQKVRFLTASPAHQKMAAGSKHIGLSHSNILPFAEIERMGAG